MYLHLYLYKSMCVCVEAFAASPAGEKGEAHVDVDMEAFAGSPTGGERGHMCVCIKTIVALRVERGSMSLCMSKGFVTPP